MIEIKNLSKKYGENLALDDINFTVESGNIIGFLGPNGAGKTTTMRILTGFMPPTSGNAYIEGSSVTENPVKVKEQVGYLPENNPLYEELTPLDYLEFCAGVRNMEKTEIKKRINEIVEICGLKEVIIKPISQLSKGYKQRVGLAQAIIHDPDVLVLDEPTTGLDPNQIGEIRELINSLKQEKTIILSTHIMQEVKALCERVIIINRGRIVADGTHDELTSKQGAQHYRVNLSGPDNEVKESLSRLDSVDEVTYDKGDMKIVCRSSVDPRKDIFELAKTRDWPIMVMLKEQRNLEDVFKKLTIKGQDNE